jgi:biotin transport system substrate-specific component
MLANTTLYHMLLILGGSLFIALCAQIRIPLPFTPVPVTGQTFAILMVGSLFGSRQGGITLLFYLLLGAIGLPVFAGGEAGWQYIQGSTFGYLLAFPLAAMLTGWLAQRGWDRKVSMTILSMILGNVVIYTFGVAWLSMLVGMQQAVVFGLLPFVVGDILKIGLAALALPGGWKLLAALKGE